MYRNVHNLFFCILLCFWSQSHTVNNAISNCVHGWTRWLFGWSGYRSCIRSDLAVVENDDSEHNLGGLILVLTNSNEMFSIRVTQVVHLSVMSRLLRVTRPSTLVLG